VVERAVLVMRHGIRAPLADEIPAGTRVSAPWPLWPVTESRVTPHGARALAIVAHADRRLLAARGLLKHDPAGGIDPRHRRGRAGPAAPICRGHAARPRRLGRADAAALPRVGALHAALFAVFTRPPYMAAHQAALLGRHVLDTLSAPKGPRFEILVGHDTNVTALAAALRVDLNAPGYAINDVPPGGALLMERLRDARSGRSFMRVSYRTQSPRQLRSLAPAVTIRPLRLPGCGGTLCNADRFSRLVRARLAEPTETTIVASLSVTGAAMMALPSRSIR